MSLEVAPAGLDIVHLILRLDFNFLNFFLFRVEIGSLLYFNSQVAYTEGNFIQVRVGAEALNPNTKELEVTNVFHYTFKLKGDPAPQIVPKTYHEAMLYLEARRHFVACTNSEEF